MAWAIKAKFDVEPFWDMAGIIFFIKKYGLGHMTKVATLSIYGKSLKYLYFSRTSSARILKLDKEHWGLNLYRVYINDNPGLPLAHISISDKRLQDHWSSGFNKMITTKL